MKRKKHSVEFVLLFEFVPLPLGKLVYSEEPFGDGSLRLYVNKLLSLFRPQENKSSYKYSYRRLVSNFLENFPMCQNAVSLLRTLNFAIYLYLYIIGVLRDCLKAIYLNTIVLFKLQHTFFFPVRLNFSSI